MERGASRLVLERLPRHRPLLVPLLLLLLLLLLSLLAATALTTPPQLRKVILSGTAASGAVCLDGSPAGYFVRLGPGKPRSWIIHFEGGGWCSSPADCLARSRTDQGSSSPWPADMVLGGMLSSEHVNNPDLYHWSVAYIKYCDGASFAGEQKDAVMVDGKAIYLRGARIRQAIFDDLLNSQGLDQAREAIITGCSAGGLAAFLHLDWVASYLPKSVTVRGMPDAGFFLDIVRWAGDPYIRPYFQSVVRTHNVSGTINAACVADKQPADQWQCFMGPYLLPYVSTPLFVLQSQYDTWQLQVSLDLPDTCWQDPNTCTAPQRQAFDNLRTMMLTQLKPAITAPHDGMWTTSCLIHCSSLDNTLWQQPTVAGQSASFTFGTWYFNRTGSVSKANDAAWPSNPSCADQRHSTPPALAFR